MSPRTTWTLLILTLALAAYLFLLDHRLDSTDQARERASRTFTFQPELVHHLRIAGLDSHIQIERTPGGWRITSPVEARANTPRVERILETLADARRGVVITAAQQKTLGLDLAHYGLDEPRLRITLQLPTQSLTLHLGRTPPLGDGIYIKRDDHPDILVLPRNLLDDIPSTLIGWRERSLFSGNPSDVRRLVIQRREQTLRLTRAEAGSWTLPGDPPIRASTLAVHDLIERLFALRIEEFTTETSAAASLYGLDDPALHISLLTTQSPVEQTLLIGSVTDPARNLVYAMLRGAPGVIALPDSILGMLDLTSTSFRDRRLLHPSAHTIRAIKLQSGETSLEFARDQATWAMLQPKPLNIHSPFIDQALATWEHARAFDITDTTDPATLAAYQLDPPRKHITFHLAPPATRETTSALPDTAPHSLSFIIGAPQPDRGLPVKKNGEPGILWVDPLLDSFSLNVSDYRPSEILALAPHAIRSIRQIFPHRELAVELAGGQPVPLPPANGYTVDPQAWLITLDILSSLQARAYITEDPRDLSLYGLDQPLATLIIGLARDAGISRTLLFGQDPHDPQIIYSKIRGSDVVFIMEPDQREHLLRPLLLPPREP